MKKYREYSYLKEDVIDGIFMYNTQLIIYDRQNYKTLFKVIADKCFC